MSIKYEALEKVLLDSQYLAEITEDIIFEAYRQAIGDIHKKEFLNFN
jgi:hypothetical protein